MDNEISNFYCGGAMGYYEKPSLSSLETAEELFQELLETRRMPSEETGMKWAEMGFILKKVSDNGTEFAVISESANTKGSGNGFYVVKLAESPSIVLQAMHTPSDLHVHRVAFRLLMESNAFVACAWNTVHRRKVDMGKEPMSYFNAFTAAVSRSFSRPRIVQLHAFDANLHKINGDLILSSSRTWESDNDHYRALVSNMRAELKPFVVLHFPKDVKVLGGTLNVNAKVFYDNNPQGKFYHVEMSLPLRLDLKDRQEIRKRFTRCFL